MVIISFHNCSWLLKTYIIEARKTGPIYVPYCVIWHQKVFFPPHKHVVTVLKCLVVKVVRIEGFLIVGKCWKFTPVLPVNLCVKKIYAEIVTRKSILTLSYLHHCPTFALRTDIALKLSHHQKRSSMLEIQMSILLSSDTRTDKSLPHQQTAKSPPPHKNCLLTSDIP